MLLRNDIPSLGALVKCQVNVTPGKVKVDAVSLDLRLIGRGLGSELGAYVTRKPE